MRVLLLLGAVGAALLFPWSSGLSPKPAQVPGPRSVEAGTTPAKQLPAARLSASLGIMPLRPDELTNTNAPRPAEPERTDPPIGRATDSTPSLPIAHRNVSRMPAGVVCENGVCVLPDRMTANVSASRAESSIREDSAHEEPHEEPADQPSGHAATELTWQAAQERLRALGALEYRLETSADSGQTHFCCTLPGNDRLHRTRQFEATAPDDMEAIARVLEQAEAWQRNFPGAFP